MPRKPSFSSVSSRPLGAAAIAIAVSAGVLVFIPEAGGAVPGRNGKIAFHSNRNGDFDIFAVNPNGSGETLLIGGPANDTDPAFSPDGSKMAFVSDRSGNPDIWVTPGAAPSNITAGPGADTQPAWSPDGTSVAFVSMRDGNPEIYVTPSAGGRPTRLTFNAVPDGSPTWSPDGSRIAFESNRDGDSDIFVMDLVSGTVKPMTDNAFGDHAPAWSPDGNRIAWHNDASGSQDIYVMAVGGGAPLRVTASPAHETSPAWAPNGSRLAFDAERRGNPEIFSIELDGTLLLRATTAVSADGSPDWRVLLPGDEPAGAVRDNTEQSVETSDSVTTDALGNGATSGDVVVSSVTAAADGIISIEESDTVQEPPEGRTFFGQQINISAPAGTPDKPLRFVFRLDAARVPSGADELTVGMWRNRMEVPACERVDGVATPDPCLLSVSQLDDGDILLIGISSAASSWNFGLRAPRQIGGAEPSPTASPSASPLPSGSPDVIRPTATGSSAPSAISPNGDGRQDELDVEVVFSETTTWAFSVSAAGSTTPVFTEGGQGGSAAITWDGSGAEEDGDYGWAVTAHDEAGNEAMPIEGAVTVDRAKPSFTVDSPRRLRKSARIRVTVDEPASVTIRIKIGRRVVKGLFGDDAQAGETVKLRWGPRDPKPGRYKIVVTVTDLAANTLIKRKSLRVS